MYVNTTIFNEIWHPAHANVGRGCQIGFVTYTAGRFFAFWRVGVQERQQQCRELRDELREQLCEQRHEPARVPQGAVCVPNPQYQDNSFAVPGGAVQKSEKNKKHNGRYRGAKVTKSALAPCVAPGHATQGTVPVAHDGRDAFARLCHRAGEYELIPRPLGVVPEIPGSSPPNVIASQFCPHCVYDKTGSQ